MPASRLVVLLFLTSTLAQTVDDDDCSDLIETCASLQYICIDSILEYHFKVISDISTQINQSASIPALESSLPLLESDLPLVLAPNEGSGSSAPIVEGSGHSLIDDETLKNALPLLKESLPLIRESLPLIRESLPLIRQYLDPLVGKSDCQKKATCRSCKECPKLRDSIISFVQSLCPNTCKVCSTGGNLLTASSGLASFFS